LRPSGRAVISVVRSFLRCGTAALCSDGNESLSLRGRLGYL
jgi:hypothetical protein